MFNMLFPQHYHVMQVIMGKIKCISYKLGNNREGLIPQGVVPFFMDYFHCFLWMQIQWLRLSTWKILREKNQ